MIDYATLYASDKLKHFDGAANLSAGNIKYGDALAAIAYVHDITYADITHQWPQVIHNERWSGGTVAQQLQFITEHKTRTPKRILEIGSGRGEVTGFLCELGYSVTSVEPSQDAHSLHSETHQQLFGKTYDYELINKPIHTVNIDYSQYDTIIMVESLEHILAEHWDPEWDKICEQFQGYFCVTNWKKYHPIAVGQYAHRDMHCRLVNDALYDEYCCAGTTLVRDRSHLTILL